MGNYVDVSFRSNVQTSAYAGTPTLLTQMTALQTGSKFLRCTKMGCFPGKGDESRGISWTHESGLIIDGWRSIADGHTIELFDLADFLGATGTESILSGRLLEVGIKICGFGSGGTTFGTQYPGGTNEQQMNGLTVTHYNVTDPGDPEYVDNLEELRRLSNSATISNLVFAGIHYGASAGNWVFTFSTALKSGSDSILELSYAVDEYHDLKTLTTAQLQHVYVAWCAKVLPRYTITV